MRDDLSDSVAGLMRIVAAEVVLPRFRNLADSEREEKAPGDWVTIADRESEERLHAGLAALDPGALIIGEEACAADPALLGKLPGARAWLIDPIDGTGNFAAGRAPFGIMIALVEDGLAVAGWMLDPLSGRLCEAQKGRGAFIDGERIAARESREPLPVAALATYFMAPGQRDAICARADGQFSVVDIPRCAAEQYPRLALGQNDVSIFERTLPWDHAAGTLFLNEAGGRVARLDGSDYRVDDGRKGMLGASSPAMWERAAQTLFG